MTTEALYVHIPFCDHICDYCAFNRFLYNQRLSDQFLDRLLSQIEALDMEFKTIYVGGGTPSSLASDQLKRLTQALSKKLAKDYEWTFEANPENLSEEKIEILKKAGVNRMSLGLQTSDDELLEKIGRKHHFSDAVRATNKLKKHGFNNFSLDLIYGLPGQSLSAFEQSIEDVLKLNPTHISLYALTIDEGSVFARTGVKAAEHDLETEMYLLAIKKMKASGYEHYEVSNFAKKGFESKHNQVYWRYDDFYALGPGASMKQDGYRRTWTRSLSEYNKGDFFDEVVKLTRNDAMFEFMMMGLRQKIGVSKKDFYRKFSVDLMEVYRKAIQKNKNKNYLVEDQDRLYLTESGLLMLDLILIELMD